MSFSLRLTVIALMLITASALAMIAYRAVTPVVVMAPSPASAPAPLQLSYRVAAHALPAGTLTRDEDFTVKPIAAASLPPGAITESPEARADLRGALVRNWIESGQPITAADVLRPRDRGFTASVLASGSRAIAIGVDPVTGVAGLIWPGDHVDVILTQTLGDKTPIAQRVMSETVLTNVRVIAIDQEISQGAPAGAAVAGKLARTVTLQVDPDQAEKLAVAQNLGKLQLTIRPAADAPARAMLSQTTFGGDVSPALSRSGEPAGTAVHVIEGNDRKVVTFQ